MQRARWALDESELATLKERAEYYGLDKTENFNEYKEKYLKVTKEPFEKTVKSNTIGLTVVKDAIDSGVVSKEINVNKQNRHIKDSDDYIDGRSYLKGNIEDAQKLIDELSGTGTSIINSKGNWTNKERVESSDILGTHVNLSDGKETETKKATIIYSKTGSHIIPERMKNNETKAVLQQKSTNCQQRRCSI